jgi:hypothetical protein
LQIPIKEERIFLSPQIEQVLRLILFKVIHLKGEATKEIKNRFKIKNKRSNLRIWRNLIRS